MHGYKEGGISSTSFEINFGFKSKPDLGARLLYQFLLLVPTVEVPFTKIITLYGV